MWAAATSVGRKAQGRSSFLFFLQPHNQIHHVQPPHPSSGFNQLPPHTFVAFRTDKIFNIFNA